MPIDAWLNREPAPLEERFRIEDYVNYSMSIYCCDTCEEEWKGLTNLEAGRLQCPCCNNRTVVLKRTLFKIWLQ